MWVSSVAEFTDDKAELAFAIVLAELAGSSIVAQPSISTRGTWTWSDHLDPEKGYLFIRWGKRKRDKSKRTKIIDDALKPILNLDSAHKNTALRYICWIQHIERARCCGRA